MKAIIVDKLSDNIKDIKYQDIAKPELKKEGDVLVKIKACGLNFYDILMIKGTYQIKQKAPFILGTEFAGIVTQVKNSKKYKVGDRVFGCGLGANAEYIAINEKALFHLPDNLSYIQGSGLFITYPTALSALKLRAELKQGESILIHGSTGGVGIVAVKMAKLLGATVIATGTDDNKLKIVKDYGADYIVNIKTEGKEWINKVKEITNKKGVDCVYDPVGLVNDSVSCLKFSGKIIVIGFAIGKHEAVQTNRILLKNISIVGLHWGAYTQHQPKVIPEIWTQILKWLTDKQLIPLIYPDIFDISETPQALSLLKDRKSYAKVVITVGDQNEVYNNINNKL
ncbi:zinc-binding dehydrogenase [Neoconidiobolus thromboides FSU 785]|nr:zinc-binding dehydrogenase [Neoconidiobolus thromboides FSU 785]